MRQVKIFKESHLTFSPEGKELGHKNPEMEECINLWIKNNPNFTVISISGSEYFSNILKETLGMCYILYDDNRENKVTL